MSRSFDHYDRDRLRPTIAHIGPGVFHRGHQAVFSDDLLRTGAVDGAIWGISLRSSAVRDALKKADFVYHVIERSDDGSTRNDVIDAPRPVGSLLGVSVASDDVEEALGHLTLPEVTVATITVTEHGYCTLEPGGPLDSTRAEIVHDLASPESPRSLPGLLLEALVRRRRAGVAPFTVVSCDNLPSNGVAVSRVVREFAECRDAKLANWVTSHVAFPSTMVDRMVPATTEDDRAYCRALGVDDAWPIITEPFTQWVIEDCFPTGRPDWGRVGVELVHDVRSHDQAKLRILNAAHSALAYWGLLAGHRFIWQAVADPALLTATRELLELEAIPTLDAPPSWDLRRYGAVVLERFGNRALRYTTAKVAGDGSQKLPTRLLPTVHALVGAGRPAERCSQVLAAWVATVAGPRAEQLGVADAAFGVPGRDATHDPRMQGLTPDDAVGTLMARPGFLKFEMPGHRTFSALVVDQARALWHGDVRELLATPAPDIYPASVCTPLRGST